MTSKKPFHYNKQDKEALHITRATQEPHQTNLLAEHLSTLRYEIEMLRRNVHFQAPICFMPQNIHSVTQKKKKKKSAKFTMMTHGDQSLPNVSKVRTRPFPFDARVRRHGAEFTGDQNDDRGKSFKCHLAFLFMTKKLSLPPSVLHPEEYMAHHSLGKMLSLLQPTDAACSFVGFSHIDDGCEGIPRMLGGYCCPIQHPLYPP